MYASMRCVFVGSRPVGHSAVSSHIETLQHAPTKSESQDESANHRHLSRPQCVKYNALYMSNYTNLTIVLITFKPKQNGSIFAGNILKMIFSDANFGLSSEIHQTLFTRVMRVKRQIIAEQMATKIYDVKSELIPLFPMNGKTPLMASGV